MSFPPESTIMTATSLIPRITAMVIVFASCKTQSPPLPAGQAAVADSVAHPKWYLHDEISPDGRFAITVPKREFLENSTSRNQLIELKTGRVVANLEGDVAYDHSNHGSYQGKWSTDGELLCWEIGGKWAQMSLVFVQLNHGMLKWQKDYTPDCVNEILRRLKAASPAAYQREKEWNKGNGSAYPEGFTVDVVLNRSCRGDVSLPCKLDIDLTSDPKHLHGTHRIDAWMDATIDKAGKLTFGEFQPKRRPQLDKF
jgi:hypothetical protein